MKTVRTIGLVTLAAALIGTWSHAADTKRRTPTSNRTVTPATETKTAADTNTTLDMVATPQPVEGTSPLVSPTPGDSEAAPVSATEQVPSATNDKTADDAVPLTDEQQVPAAPAAYDIQWQSLNSGGAPASSATYELNATVGEAVIGETTDTEDTAQAGYWYGAFAVSCVCDCHADPQCDGVTNVLDVVQAVNVAFRSWSPVFDPACPRERTDVDCSGFTNVIDVVKFVNVAFRGGDPAVNFCDPCAP